MYRNFADPDMYPHTQETEFKCIRWLHDLWNGPKDAEPYGAATIGSSEACMLGGLAHKWNWREARHKAGKDASRPNMVTGGNVQTVAAGRCRTRIIQQGVQPSLHVYYKNTHLKQYHKEGRALRTETTINNTYDFQVGRLLKNLPRLREIGFGANRRVLEVEKVSHDSQVGAKVFEKMQKPLEVEGQHASALRFGDPRVQALLSVLLLFAVQPQGVRNRQLRPLLAQCLGLAQNQITQAMMSYDLRRLRLHGIIERIEATHRYRLTAAGMKTAFLYSRLYLRALRPALSELHAQGQAPHPIQQTLHKLQRQIDSYYADKLAA